MSTVEQFTAAVPHFQNQEESLRRYQMALRQNPDDAGLWLEYGDALREWYWSLGDELGEAANLVTNPNFASDDSSVIAARRVVETFQGAQADIAEFLLNISKLQDMPRVPFSALSVSHEEGIGTPLLEFAIHCFRMAAALEPNAFQTHCNLGMALFDSSYIDEAATAFRRAIEIDPSVPELHYFLGCTEQERGNLPGAIAHYRDALERMPDYAEAWRQLCSAYLYANELDKAEDAIAKCLNLSDKGVNPFAEFVKLQVACRRYDVAAEAALEVVLAQRGFTESQPPLSEWPKRLNETKLRHDIDQLEYLLARGRIDAAWREVVPEYRRLLDALSGAVYRDIENIDPPVSRRFLSAYRGLVHHDAAPVIPEGALDPAIDADAVIARFRDSTPPAVYFDSLLKPEAAERLRRFCLESTIWFNDKDAGDVGTFIEDGFACPLLFQVAQEIREAFWPLLEPHPFSACWAYKYYAESSGVNLHADEGAMSVNFWLTPDDANAAPDTGGLIFWNRRCPDGYFRMSQVSKNAALLKAVEGRDGEKTVVPYAYNRAALFRSNLIHATDRLDFAPGYENRRINVTLVYGRPQK